jgi:hypothetical protein
MGVKLKNALSSAISFSGAAKVGSVTCIGSGGPFDVEEGNSAFVFKSGKTSVLVNCGSTVYASLSKLGMITEIGIIVITSCSESNIGSLNTLVSHLHYHRSQHQDSSVVNVFCASHLSERLNDYLLSGGLDENIVKVSSINDDINFFETAPTESGFSLRLNTVPPAHIIHSGTTPDPVFNSMKEFLYTLRADPSNVIVFHEASLFDSESSCHYEKLSEWSEVFKNFFTFGHNKENGTTMTFNERYMRSLSTSNGHNEFTIEKTATL